MRLTPKATNDLGLNFVESYFADKLFGTDYTISCVEQYLYVSVVSGPVSTDISYLLDLKSTQCQTDQVQGNSLQQKTFTVPPSTYALTVCFQDSRVGQNTRYSPTKFKSYADNTPAPGTPLGPDLVPNLLRFAVRYAGQQLPSPDWDPQYISAVGPNPGPAVLGTDYLSELYYRQLIETFQLYGGEQTETIQRWREKGMMMHMQVPKDGSDRSTQCTVIYQFTPTTQTQNMKVLVFAHYRSVGRIVTGDGLIRQVSIEDA